VGTAIAADLQSWAEREKIAPDDSFLALRPARGELRAALAREAMCSDALLETVMREDGTRARSDGAGSSMGPSTVPWHARRFVEMERERRMVRLWAGQRLARCATASDEDLAFDACIRQDDARELPKSVVVQAMAIAVPRSVASQLDAYRVWATPRP
jgi:hypothetical protein